MHQVPGVRARQDRVSTHALPAPVDPWPCAQREPEGRLPPPLHLQPRSARVVHSKRQRGKVLDASIPQCQSGLTDLKVCQQAMPTWIPTVVMPAPALPTTPHIYLKLLRILRNTTAHQ